MKLLLDEMYPPRLAEKLRRRGHAVVAVEERPELKGMEDESLLIAATSDERVLVTENVADFPEIVATLGAEGRSHSGVILVASRTFPRTDRGFGQLVRALDAYLERHATEQTVRDGIHWLSAR